MLNPRWRRCLQGAVDARWVVISCFLLFGVVVVVAQLSSCLRVLVAVAFWLSARVACRVCLYTLRIDGSLQSAAIDAATP